MYPASQDCWCIGDGDSPFQDDGFCSCLISLCEPGRRDETPVRVQIQNGVDIVEASRAFVFNLLRFDVTDIDLRASLQPRVHERLAQ